MRSDTDNYRQLFLEDPPLMDTRAPVEFAQGAFPNAVNLPLLNDGERERVGIRYRERGQRAAVELGGELVSGDVKARRLESWCRFARDNPRGYLYCFRGGLRSRTVQQWLGEAGTHYPLVAGGYKAMRRFLLAELDRSLTTAGLLLVAGKTGTGKTRVVESVERSADLEGFARHRGSSFGSLPGRQATQTDFENALSIRLLRLLDGDDRDILLEDEGKLIGPICLPAALRERMQSAPLLVVEEPLEARVDIILDDYIRDLGSRYRQCHGERGERFHRRHLLDALARIRKRLGGLLHSRLETRVAGAFAAPAAEREALHRQWIRTLLLEYYDPMYEYQMERRGGSVLLRGSRREIIACARERTGSGG